MHRSPRPARAVALARPRTALLTAWLVAGFALASLLAALGAR